jgi:hypothetical protein
MRHAALHTVVVRVEVAEEVGVAVGDLAVPESVDRQACPGDDLVERARKRRTAIVARRPGGCRACGKLVQATGTAQGAGR